MTRPQLSVSAAVEAFDIERRTLQRLLATGQLTGASKDKRGRWSIPVETLHMAGFAARKTWMRDATKTTTRRDIVATNTRQPLQNTGEDGATDDATARDTDATELRNRITQLEAQLDYERRLKEAIERNTEDLRSSLRMLEAGTAANPRSQRWWHRSV
jgi:hypothetical protein